MRALLHAKVPSYTQAGDLQLPRKHLLMQPSLLPSGESHLWSCAHLDCRLKAEAMPFFVLAMI